MRKAKIVSAARSWIGTRFKYQGRIKKTNEQSGGCDCFGIIIGIADELFISSKNGDYLKNFDVRSYSAIPNSDELLSFCKNHFIEVKKNEISPGDIVLFSFNKAPQHLAIIAEINNQLTIIHSYIMAKKIVEQSLDDYWIKHIHSCYRFCD